MLDNVLSENGFMNMVFDLAFELEINSSNFLLVKYVPTKKLSDSLFALISRKYLQ